MSDRTRRLDELLREEISNVIRREVDDPRIGFVTITEVEATPDLRHATVWVSIIGSADEKRMTLRALSRAEGVTGAVRYDALLKIKLEDGKTQKVRVPFTPGTHGFEAEEGALVATKAFVSATIVLDFFADTGEAWFDEVCLSQE